MQYPSIASQPKSALLNGKNFQKEISEISPEDFQARRQNLVHVTPSNAKETNASVEFLSTESQIMIEKLCDAKKESPIPEDDSLQWK